MTGWRVAAGKTWMPDRKSSTRYALAPGVGAHANRWVGASLVGVRPDFAVELGVRRWHGLLGASATPSAAVCALRRLSEAGCLESRRRAWGSASWTGCAVRPISEWICTSVSEKTRKGGRCAGHRSSEVFDSAVLPHLMCGFTRACPVFLLEGCAVFSCGRARYDGILGDFSDVSRFARDGSMRTSSGLTCSSIGSRVISAATVMTFPHVLGVSEAPLETLSAESGRSVGTQDSPATRSVVESGITGGILRRLLGSGGAAAPERESLALLPSGPDAVRTLPVRGTRSSTPRAQTLSRRTVPRTAFGPAWSGFRVQGTADSPPSAAEQAEGTTSLVTTIEVAT